MNNFKDKLKSKTLWFGALFLIVAIANLFGFSEFKPDGDLLAILAVIQPLVMIILRFFTKEPIHL